MVAHYRFLVCPWTSICKWQSTHSVNFSIKFMPQMGGLKTCKYNPELLLYAQWYVCPWLPSRTPMLLHEGWVGLNLPRKCLDAPLGELQIRSHQSKLEIMLFHSGRSKRSLTRQNTRVESSEYSCKYWFTDNSFLLLYHPGDLYDHVAEIASLQGWFSWPQ